MKSRNALFLVTCLGILSGLLWSYSMFLEYFGENGPDKMRADAIARDLREERFARDLAEARLRDLGQEVAAALPKASEAKLADAGYELNKIATTLREPAAVTLELSGARLAKAKRLFADKDYKSAAREFELIAKDYPTSPNSVEAYFLWAESSYLLRDEKKVVELADLMVSQYPESDLTGFVLLRFGQINERNNREEEASEIYHTVMKSFRHPALVEQAKRMAKSVEVQ